MRTLIEVIIDALRISTPWQPYVAGVVAFAGAFAIVLVAALYGGLFSYVERRVAGRMMARIGPNRVGPHGLLQFVADALKMVTKEDIIPYAADRPLFRFGPYLVTIGVMSGFAVLPLSRRVIPADLNVGVLYVLAVTSVSVVGLLMSGWASNSKWALFGGMRAAAQIVSYEIPTGMAILPAVMLAGTMSTQGIIMAQGGEPWNWFIFHSPMMLVLFVVFFVSSLAEGSRTPFDLPEAESELVSGYNTEYSGFRFAAYFMSEFANTWIPSALATVVFLGGWQIPFVALATVDSSTGWLALVYELLGLGIFVGKSLVLAFLIIQLRWTLPRVRVDQLMLICWKYLVPIVFVMIFLILGWMVLIPWESTAGLIVRFGMFLMTCAFVLAYVWRIRFNIVAAGATPYYRWWI